MLLVFPLEEYVQNLQVLLETYAIFVGLCRCLSLLAFFIPFSEKVESKQAGAGVDGAEDDW